MEYDTKEFRQTIQGKELAQKYKNARATGAEGPEFETFENFCNWAFANGYKPGMRLCRGEGDTRYKASTSYFRATGEKRIKRKQGNRREELKKSIERFDDTVNSIRRAVGWDPLPVREDGADDC